MATTGPESPRDIAARDMGAPRVRRIVLTGGPGGGKTTAADMISRELPDRVIVLRETATILFGGGFPRNGGLRAKRACQRAIYRTQVEMEEAVAAEHGDRILLCDRGTIDGSAYWPEGPDAFFAELGTSRERELSRYEAVLFFESAAVGGMGVDRGNPFRVESADEAVRLDRSLRQAWEGHPRFHAIPHRRSFLAKVEEALAVFRDVVGER